MASLFKPAPEPKSELGFHRILAPSAGVRVSPLCLGAMNFGDAWKEMLGECDKDTSFEILDYFYSQGGNFIDTANNYQSEQSEQWLGEWMESRGVRDQMVIATKFTTGFKSYTLYSDKPEITSNSQGNHAKSLHVSLAASLKKLRTDYVDLLYLHWWDFSTGIPELMQSLNTMVQQGKVLYLGVSDTPAWIVSKANEYARQHGFRPFSVYQGKWNAAVRDFERDIIPMARDEGMALCPWSAIGGGLFKTEEQRKSGEGRKMYETDEKHIKVSAALEKVANRKGTIITSVALAYVMAKVPHVVPIVGGRNVNHLKGNIEALKLKLSKEDIKEIEDAYPFDAGFPMNFIFMGQEVSTDLTSENIMPLNSNTNLRSLPHQKVSSILKHDVMNHFG